MSDDARAPGALPFGPLPEPPAPSQSALRRALARARDGKALDQAEATTLLHARGEHLARLLEYASRTRDAGLIAAGRPAIITYSKKVFIPLTRLCRDRCGYCTFATVPGRLPSPYLSPDEVIDIASQGAALGCKEALFTLGDRPEDRWPQAREWLDANGYDDTLSYVRAMAIRVLEVIVQNFRAKPDTKMRGTPDAGLDDLAATIAVTRLVLGPSMRIQAPPNLIGDQYALILAAGIDDWGGVSPLTPDHVNPERPWPQIDDLAGHTAAAGFTLCERLTAYPGYLREPWLDPRLTAHVAALADPGTGLASESALPRGLPWQEPDGGWGDATGRTDLHVTIDTTGRTKDRRDDFAEVYGDWAEIGARIEPAARHAAPAAAPPRLRADVRAALRKAERDPAGLTDAQALALLDADGPELAALAALADALRAEAAGEDVSYVVTRNINFTNVCYTGCRFCAFAQRRTDADAYTLSLTQVGDRAEEAWGAGATEVCMQGGIHPDLPGTAYFDLAAEVKRRCPDIHVHAFSPMEVMNGASRTGLPVREWLVRAREAGLGSLPGTAAEILDDDVRWVLTKGKLPAAAWIEVITTAHELGIPTSSTMMYGHVDTPAHWVGHLRVIRGIQQRTGGFTEFVLLPFVHANAPIYLAGLARPGPTRRENRAVHALSRLLLHGAISNIQCSWVKLTGEVCRDVLRGGANDIGGTLMEETISRMAGSEQGSYKTISDMEAMIAPLGRPLRQRTTLYGRPSAERLAASTASDGVCASVRGGRP